MSSISALDSLLSSSSTSSAIDLSAILQAATGSATPGIDVEAAVTSSVTAAQAPEQAWELEEAGLQNQSTALTQLQTDATNLDNDLLAINNLSGPFAQATVSSSNSSLVTGSAAAGSVAGNYVVVVNNLATTASFSSTAVASATTALPAESITITPAGGSAATFTTGSGVNTLSDLENAINSAGLGVSASIITDANGARLAITSNTSGSAADFSVSSMGGSFDFTRAATGANASLTLNGIAVSSATNTVTGAVPGVTINLLGASQGAEVSLAVAPNTSAASASISQFVSDYNTLITALNAQFSDDGSGQGVLADDPTVRALQSELLGSLNFTATTGTGTNLTATSLQSLGITVNDDGTLAVNSTTLNSALQNNFSNVQNFFQGSALNGFANTLDQTLTSFLSPADGAFTVDLQSLNTEYTGLQTNINNFETNVITPLRTQLTNEFSSAEASLQQLPTMLKNIDLELGINQSSGS